MRAAVALTFALLSAPALAEGWPVEEMNKQIDATNFIVNAGCSGTLISVNERLILTNYHCINDKVSSIEREVTGGDGSVKKVKVRKYEDVTVAQNSYDGFIRTGSSTYVAEIVAEAQTRDLAVLRIKGNIPHSYASPLLPEGRKVSRGERVYVVGNPLGEDGSLVEGVVSSVNRAYDFPWTAGARLPMIQFSGGIIGGNSGGALYGSTGYLIGVPAAGSTSASFIGLAIPVDVVRAFLRDNCFASVFDNAADDKKCREDKEKKKKDE